MPPKSKYDKMVSMTTTKQKYYKQAVCWGKEEKVSAIGTLASISTIWTTACMDWVKRDGVVQQAVLNLIAGVEHGFLPLQQVAPL